MNYIIELNITFSPEDKTLSLLNESSNTVVLSNQATRLLLEMITTPNTPLEREDLIKRVWEDYGFTSSNNSLNVAISEIRKAFSLLGKDPQIITTIPKVGFKFDGRIEPAIKIPEEVKHNAHRDLKDSSKASDEKQKRERASLTFCSVIFIMSIIFAFYSFTVSSSKLKLENEEYTLLYTDSKCRIYNLDRETKNLDIANIKKEITQFIKNCDTDRMDVFYKKMQPNNINSTTFVGFCTFDENEYKNCLTAKNNSGYEN